MLYFGVKGFLIAVGSVGWLGTDAVVTSSTVKRYISSSAGGRTQHQAEIHHEFFVRKNRYDGYHRHTSPDAGKAMSLVGRYPEGKQITVYYMPDHPAKNLLESGVTVQTWIMPAGGPILLIPGILMAVFLPRLMEKAD